MRKFYSYAIYILKYIHKQLNTKTLSIVDLSSDALFQSVYTIFPSTNVLQLQERE